MTVGALTIALTITVIDSAIRRESKRRIHPRVESVNYWLGLELLGRDSPYYRASKGTFTIQLSHVMVLLPTT